MSDILITLMAGRQYTLEASNLPLHTFRSGSAGTIIIPDGDFVIIKDEGGGTVFYHKKSVSDASKAVLISIKDNAACTHTVIAVKTESGKKYVKNLSENSTTFGSDLVRGAVENRSSGHIVVPGDVTTAINHSRGSIIIRGNAENVVNKSGGSVEVDGIVTGNILNASTGKITVWGKRCGVVVVESQWKNIVSWLTREECLVVLITLLPFFIIIAVFMAYFLNLIFDKF